MKKNLPSISQKLISKVSLALLGVLIAVTGFGQIVDTIPGAEDHIPHGYGSDPRSTYTYSTGDVINYLTATITGSNFTFVPASVTSSTTNACAPAKRRIQTNAFEITVNSTSVSKIVITGNSSGTSVRHLRALFVDDVLEIADGNDPRVKSFHPGGADVAGCADIIIDGLNIAKGQKIKIVIAGSATGSAQNFRVNALTFTSSVLPVRLLSFDAINLSNGVEVMWQADKETEGRSYSVERSNNGVAFEEINKVETLGAGSYSFLDKTAKLGPVAYYRLQMISVDGEKTYSKIKAVVLNGTNTLYISPNPVRGNSLNATFKPFTEPTTVKILNTSGKVLLTQQIAPFTSQSSINTSGLSKGIYMIQFVNGTEVKTSRFLKD